MTSPKPAATRQPIRVERTYTAPVEDLWELWTTKDGFAAWWGPVGFHVDVHAFDARPGGELNYDMVAHDEQYIADMKAMGRPAAHGTHGTFEVVEPMKRLRIRHIIDFIPGQEPYPNDILVEFEPRGDQVTMVVHIDPHMSDEMTGQAREGFESQLTKIPALLEARRNS